LFLPPALHLDPAGNPARFPGGVASRQPDPHRLKTKAGFINSMSNLPKYYFRDIPAYLMDEIITGMIDGKIEPTPEEMEEWLASDLEREAEMLLAQYS
jgi:hypothetical protein